MSFNVNWNSLETDSLRNWTQELLTDALNSGRRPNILASDIQIKDLNFGKIAPNFEILEIGELGRDRFRGIFKISYDGDFHLTLHTKVQANPLKLYSSNSLDNEVNHLDEFNNFVTPSFLLSDEPFALPLDLKLSDIKISGIGIIVFSKSKGLTLVFRNDPLDSIKVSSTFDTVQVLADFLQKQIETQIRDLFRETLPTVIHQLSLKYTSLNETELIDLHSKLKSKINSHLEADKMDRVSLSDIDPDCSYSVNNLHKTASLFKSRETLSLNISKFKNTIQRSRLEKFEKNMPNLINTLKSSLELSGFNVGRDPALQCNNGIPIELLLSQQRGGDREVDNILKEISNIQSKSYYSRLNNNSAVKPKRRVIKIGGIKRKNTEEKSPETTVDYGDTTSTHIDSVGDLTSVGSSPTLNSCENSMSMDKINPVDLKQPKPIRAVNDVTEGRPPMIQLHSHFQPYNTSNCYSPSFNSNSSLLSGVGLGNNYFNFTTNNQITTTPITSDEKCLKNKKSINYIDIKTINKNLGNLRKLELDKRANASSYPSSTTTSSGNVFELPPPPYQV